MALTLHYFSEFGKLAFQHMTASVRIELTDQHRAVKFARVT